MEKKELGIYIHIPFCVKKCAYCDFLSVTAKEEKQAEYLRKLLGEIRSFGEFAADYEVDTVFIGGGTPSVLSKGWIKEIMQALNQIFSVKRQAEITIEGNPGTLNREKLSEYREAGINRLSIGLQSVHAKELTLLGRIHSYQDFLENFRNAKKEGFENINIDLMFGLPGQTPVSFRETLETAVSLSPSHISAYGLILEEGTPFYQKYREDEKQREKGLSTLLLPSEEEEREMYEDTKKILEKNGYDQYEISNYAKPGFACRHNCRYWQRKPYLGLGIGAASLIEEKRVSNPAEFNQYGRQALTEQIKNASPLPVKEQMEEFMFLGLRMREGVSMEEFQRRFGKTVGEVYGEALEKLKKEKLIRFLSGRLFLTERGIEVSNYALSEFIMD